MNHLVPSDSGYASFGDRAIAFTIDSAILFLPSLFAQAIVPIAGPVLLGILYKVLFEASAVEATPGKRIMEIRVITLEGQRISLRAALIRYAVSCLSLACLGAGHWVALFSSRRQAVHDLIAETLVVRGKVPLELFEAWASEFKTSLRRAKDIFHRPVPPKDEREILELLEKLHSLRQNGALTEEEYLAQKKALLRQS